MHKDTETSTSYKQHKTKSIFLNVFEQHAKAMESSLTLSYPRDV